MSRTPNLDELRYVVEDFAELLRDPHPGLLGWLITFNAKGFVLKQKLDEYVVEIKTDEG